MLILNHSLDANFQQCIHSPDERNCILNHSKESSQFCAGGLLLNLRLNNRGVN